MELWIILTFIYAVFNGFFQCGKKRATEKNSIYEVLAFFTLISFLIAIFITKDVFSISVINVLIILGKAIVISIAWLLGLYVLEKMPISLYSVINLSRIIFTVLLSVILLGEKITLTTIIGIIVVIIGLILVNMGSNKKEKKETSLKLIIILLVSCLFTSTSAIIDKTVLKNITTDQLLFWFLLFLTVIFWFVLGVKKTKIDFKSASKNYWLLVVAAALTFGDKLLYVANTIPESKVSIMTIIKQFSAIEMVLLGKIVFKEKNITKKLLCSLLIISGIILTII